MSEKEYFEIQVADEEYCIEEMKKCNIVGIQSKTIGDVLVEKKDALKLLKWMVEEGKWELTELADCYAEIFEEIFKQTKY